VVSNHCACLTRRRSPSAGSGQAFGSLRSLPDERPVSSAPTGLEIYFGRFPRTAQRLSWANIQRSSGADFGDAVHPNRNSTRRVKMLRMTAERGARCLGGSGGPGLKALSICSVFRGLNRLGKKALFVAKSIPQGLKPDSFYWL